MITSLFQKSPSHSSAAIFQQHQRIRFTFHLYDMPEFIPNTVISWTEPSCWGKSTQSWLRCSYVEVVAIEIIPPSSRTGWLLRNINFSNCNGSFPLYERVVTDDTFTGSHYMSVTAGVVRFIYEVRVPHFLAFCVVSCFLCSMLPVCLNCSFLIAPSVFSNRYSWQLENTQVVNTLKSCIYYSKNLLF